MVDIWTVFNNMSDFIGTESNKIVIPCNKYIIKMHTKLFHIPYMTIISIKSNV